MPGVVVDCLLLGRGSLELMDIRTAAFDINHLSVLLLVPVEPDVYITSEFSKNSKAVGPLTRNENIPVMHNEILNDVGRVLNNIHVPPVHPAVVRLHRR